MGWIALVLGLGLSAWLLMTFPKQTLGVIGFIVLLIAVFIYRMHSEDQRAEREKEQVVITITPTLGEGCDAEFPLLITVRNTTSKTLNSAAWHMAAYRPGYSSNLIEGYERYESDKILQPKETFTACYRLPPIKEGHPFQRLEWKAESKYVVFAD